MKLDLKAFLALLLAFVAVAEARTSYKADLVEGNLPRMDEEKAGTLDPDEDEYSGDYDDEYYYDDEYEDDEKDYSQEENEKDVDIVLDDVKLVKPDGEDFHFDEEEMQEEEGDDLLFEYYNEVYEEDYNEVGLSDVETGILRGKTNEPQELPKSENGFDYTNVLAMVASGTVSFSLFTLILMFCFNRRIRGKAFVKQKNLASIKLGSSEKPGPAIIKTSGYHVSPPPSSIVKNYHLVPQDAVEFLSTSSSSQTGMENASHNGKDQPLLP